MNDNKRLDFFGVAVASMILTSVVVEVKPPKWLSEANANFLKRSASVAADLRFLVQEECL